MAARERVKDHTRKATKEAKENQTSHATMSSGMITVGSRDKGAFTDMTPQHINTTQKAAAEAAAKGKRAARKADPTMVVLTTEDLTMEAQTMVDQIMADHITTKAAAKAVGKKNPSAKLNPCRVGTIQCIGVPVAINISNTEASSANREGYNNGKCFPLVFRDLCDHFIKKTVQISASKVTINVQPKPGSKTGEGK